MTKSGVGNRPLESRARAGRAWLLAWALVGGAAFASCKDKGSGAVPDAGTSSASAGSSAAPAPTEEEPEDRVQAVYPVDDQPPAPIAQAYCDAVQETSKRRREECCPSIGAFAPTAECARTLSAALRSGAVTLDQAAVAACAKAVAAAVTGCDWIRPVGGAPTVPACLGIIKGTIKVGGRCRSNLECADGVRCRGLGATQAGKCTPPDNLHYCNISTDSLAAWTAQDDFDRHHPDCTGYCARGRCADAVPLGGACDASVQCGPNAWCIGNKCSAGPLPGPGTPCTDVCAFDSRCTKGKCLAMKAEGEPCETSAECRVHCERNEHGDGDGGEGHCARLCPSFPKPMAPAASSQKRGEKQPPK